MTEQNTTIEQLRAVLEDYDYIELLYMGVWCEVETLRYAGVASGRALVGLSGVVDFELELDHPVTWRGVQYGD